jgi:hypothetical protein
VEDQLLQSLPPSQDYLTPPDSAAQLFKAFPQMLLQFEEAEAVQLMMSGMRDSDAVGCIEHGVKKDSSSTAQPNPVDAV